jgi:PPOX class probable F420-dependent enzyme
VDDAPWTSDDLAFLDSERVARLATADEAGRPYVVPVCFVQLRQRVYIPIDAKPKSGDPRDLKRLRNILVQPQVALLLDRYDEDWSGLRWLLIRAQASVLESGKERAAALAALEARYPQYAAMGLLELGLPVIKLEPLAVSRWSAGR